jgi:hypothetical protein
MPSKRQAKAARLNKAITRAIHKTNTAIRRRAAELARDPELMKKIDAEIAAAKDTRSYIQQAPQLATEDTYAS